MPRVRKRPQPGKKVRDRSSFALVEWVPEAGYCSCGAAQTIQQHRCRPLQTLHSKLLIVQKDRRCSGSEDCPARSAIVRPSCEQGRLIVKDCEYGLDVIALIGERYVQNHHSFGQIHKELTEHGVDISARHVPNLFRLFLAMAGARTLNSEAVRTRLEAQGRLVLSVDAVRFDEVSPPLYALRDILSEEVLVTERIETPDTQRLVKFLSQVLALNIPIDAIISDHEKALVAAIAEAFPGVPHQYCQTHFLGNLVKPMESDLAALGSGVEKVAKQLRQFEKRLKAEEWVDSKVEADLERTTKQNIKEVAAEGQEPPMDVDPKGMAAESKVAGKSAKGPEQPVDTDPRVATNLGTVDESKVVTDSKDGPDSQTEAKRKDADSERALVKKVCQAAKVFSKTRGDKILDPTSLKRFNRLEELENLTRKAVERKGGEWPLLRKLLTILTLLTPLVGLARRLQRQVEIVRHIAHLLNLETSGKWVERRLNCYVKKLEKEAPQRGRGAERGRFHEHVIELCERYWKGLFHCYDIDGLPNNNNEMESFFGAVKWHDRKVRGNKSNAGGPLESFGPYLVQLWGTLKDKPFLALLLEDLTPLELQRARDAIQALTEPARERRSFIRDPEAHLKKAVESWLKA